MNKLFKQFAGLPNTLKREYHKNPRMFWLRSIYIAGLAYTVIFWRAVWTPDLLFFMLLGLAGLYGMGRQFLTQFGPFVILLLAYDSLRSIAPFLNHHVHYYEMINFDKWMTGGTLPTVDLQHIFYHGYLAWYDYYLYFLYMCHFLVPFIVALLIWRLRPAHYNRFVVAFLILSYAGFLTYIIFPAAPPWMASEMGMIPHIHKISTDIWWALGVHNYPSIYREFSPNLVAAVPSLHAAYPTLITLFVWRAFGWRWGLATIWYPLSMWFGIIYMGEHYIFDALLGIAYAAAAYYATMLLFRHYGHHARRIKGKTMHHARKLVGRPSILVDESLQKP
jgi:hypothetical protein